MRKSPLIMACLMVSQTALAEWTLENVPKVTRNSASEPIAVDFSLDKGVAFLDQAALDWTGRRKCFTCHTNFAYLMARPMAGHNASAHQQVRRELESLVNTHWHSEGPRWDAEVIMSAAVLAINDAQTTHQLSETTRTALDRMWTLQREDGGFDWLKCGWPPMEIDDDYGIAIAAIAAGAAPDDYVTTTAAVEGISNLRKYLSNHPPPSLHHTAMLMWADGYGTQLLTAEQKRSAIEQLRSLQKADGGWSTAMLADWQREDGSEQERELSDAYGTAFVSFVMQRAGIAVTDSAVAKGIAWLKANQRESGRWFSRSLYKDSTHYLSHAATAMAVMAIQSAQPNR